MVTIQYQKVKCDNCGKTVEMKNEYGNHPRGWYDIEINQWYGSRGEGRFYKEICSQKCLNEVMHKFKKLEPRKPIMIL